MFILENEVLKIEVNPKGAELNSVYHKDFGLEYMWLGDAQYWGKKSPVLFPIVGSLKDNTYFYKGQKYTLPRHGFARDCVFNLEEKEVDTLIFTLKHNADTLKNYPFEFTFKLKYTLKNNCLSVTYIVENQSVSNMPFSVGAHPAFAVPLVENTNYEDYYLELEKSETLGRYPLSIDGLIELDSNTFLDNSDIIPLKQKLFYSDAVVIKDMKSSCMSLKSSMTAHGLSMNFKDFPYFGIWSAKNAPFVCLEPWCGIADNVATSQDIFEKEGINILPKSAIFERTWSIDIF